MITRDDYLNILGLQGKNLAQVRKSESEFVINQTFTGDPNYKRVYILDVKDGWKYTDAKFSRHAKQSISKDAVDYYLQFRPKEHYPIGSYVYIPDDTSSTLTFEDEKNPLKATTQKNLWMIVDRNEMPLFVRYLVLPVDWNFRWVSSLGPKVYVANCWGCARAANSYTSGTWNDYYTNGLDNLTNSWVPNTHYIYGDEGLAKYGIEDTRSLKIQERMMITLNVINPNCYMITKVGDLNPKGIIKLSLKQDEYNVKRDNVNLMVCDYWNDTGNIATDKPTGTDTGTSKIVHCIINSDGELDTDTTTLSQPFEIKIAQIEYFKAEFSADNITAHWRISLKDGGDDAESLEKMMVMREVNGTTISIKPGKSSRLVDKTFTLTVTDVDGNYESSIELKVIS